MAQARAARRVVRIVCLNWFMSKHRRLVYCANPSRGAYGRPGRLGIRAGIRYISSDSDPKHARSQVSPARGESRFPAGRRGARALTRAEHIGMEGVLRLLQLRQMRQKKAEVHTGSPGVTEDALRRKASRPGRALSSARGGSRLPAFLRAIQKEAA